MEARNGFTRNQAWPFINASMRNRARSNAQIQLICPRTSIPSPLPQVARHDVVFILSPFVLLWRQCGNKDLRAQKTENTFWQQCTITLPAPQRVHPAVRPQGHLAAGPWSCSTLESPPCLPSPFLPLICWTPGDEQLYHFCFSLQQKTIHKPAFDLWALQLGSPLPSLRSE